jgi:hypothetical protein
VAVEAESKGEAVRAAERQGVTVRDVRLDKAWELEVAFAPFAAVAGVSGSGPTHALDYAGPRAAEVRRRGEYEWYVAPCSMNGDAPGQGLADLLNTLERGGWEIFAILPTAPPNVAVVARRVRAM